MVSIRPRSPPLPPPLRMRDPCAIHAVRDPEPKCEILAFGMPLKLSDPIRPVYPFIIHGRDGSFYQNECEGIRDSQPNVQHNGWVTILLHGLIRHV